jgi:hypothetical protein
MNHPIRFVLRFAPVALVCLLSASTVTHAQTVRARVLLMVDTSGSMTEHIDSNTDSFADGSTVYRDALMTRDSTTFGGGFQLYPGIALTNACSATATYDGSNSRLFNAKAAVTDVVNGSGDIDWGLMRYAGTYCPILDTTGGGSNRACTNDFPCNADEFCIGGRCHPNNNLCHNDQYGGSDERPNSSACANNYDLPVTYAGNCGNTGTANAAPCNTVQTCFADSDCNGAKAGQCAALAGSGAKACQCGGTFAACPANYTCTGGVCRFNESCIDTSGGVIFVDPSMPSSNQAILRWVDGVEDYNRSTGTGPSVVTGAAAGHSRITGLSGVDSTWVGVNMTFAGAASAGNNGSFAVSQVNSPTSVDITNAGAVVNDANNGAVGFTWTIKLPTNPEMRAVGNTPLGGAARAATAWYNNIKNNNLDAQIACRPYVLVQITDGFDTCDTDAANGPVAAAQGFVASTVSGARVTNKVYMIGLNLSSSTLDAVAKAGGTGSARLATSQSDIEAALADIVASSVLVEKCNGIDDDCNGICDDPFPDVAIPATSVCSNKGQAAKSCDNGKLPGTHCYATGTYVCSADQLSEVCSAPSCASNAALCPTTEAAGGCNGIDDDCNGVIDDCTPFVANSCCASKCPACAAGGPFPETCDGCDNDCDGIIDNHLTDTGQSCGSSVGQCKPGTTFCCQEASPTTGSCTQSQATSGNPDRLVCLGGVNPQPISCNGCDNNCDGQLDAPSQSCYTGPAGTNGVGLCHGGTQICNASVCPSAASFGACSGQVLPVPEVCNGLDDNCNGTVDDNVTDPWTGTACCSTGNNADCTNSGGSLQCKTGTFQCVSGGKTCVGSVAKAPETCNGVDDDCNGIVDDVPGKGAACTAAGVNTTGQCKAAYTCVGGAPGPGPNGLTCVQTVGPTAEVCNGLDDNCNGQTDEGNPGGGAACGSNVGQCKQGTTACLNGALVCQGGVLPAPEVCNGLDDNCNGLTDENPTDPWINQACCSTGVLSDCTNTGTGNRCKTSAFACVNGKQACNGSIAKSVEVCNGIDDDCNGITDDVPGVGTACTGTGINTTGQCTAAYQCVGGAPGPGPNGLTCVQKQGPVAEVCNGLDDNCNGQTDEGNPGGGVVCGSNCPGGLVANCVGVCKPGTTVCTNGALVCGGSVGGSPEVCNGLDDDCDGITDDHLTDPWVGTACCPTGNPADCMNTGTGSRCHPGAFACVAGMRTCSMAVAKSPEVCNGIDDDCNGITDDVPGLGSPCSSPSVKTAGPCTATYQCKGAMGTGPNGLTCTQVVGPMPELCNGIDDDCNGVVDDNLMDMRVGVTGGSPCTPLTPLAGTTFPAGGPAPPCNPGVTVCKNGMVACSGEVGPQPNICNGVATDCTGKPNTNGSCPTGFMCYQGNCNQICAGGEFPCPGGFRCDTTQNPPTGVCIPDKCATANCPTGFNCVIDSTGNASCVDPCSLINCPTGYQCKVGVCLDCTNPSVGCPTGQKCAGTPPMCVNDPCFGVMCPAGQFCDANGNCSNPCATCLKGQICVNGMCQDDPCAHVTCTADQVCVVQGGAATCVVSQCSQGCNPGLVCCQGAMCINDPCAGFACPVDTNCKLDDLCNASCQAIDKDNIAGQGGGGVPSCGYGGSGGERTPLGGAVLLLLLLLGATRRRRA